MTGMNAPTVARQVHISTVAVNDNGCTPIRFDDDGICHCDPQPDTTFPGECPQCKRLDIRWAGRSRPNDPVTT